MDKFGLNICKSIKSLAILKFIIKTINIDELDKKLIFVGNHNDNIKLILSKLENNKNSKPFDSIDSIDSIYSNDSIDNNDNIK